MTNFEICQLLATPGPFEYLGQKPRGSENQSFLDEGAYKTSTRLGGVLGGQIPRLYGGTIFVGVQHTWGSSEAFKTKVPIFDIFATA